MPIQIRPADPADSREIASLGRRAFTNDPLSKAIFDMESASPSQIEAFLDFRSMRIAAGIAKDRCHWFKAVDSETGAIVGSAGVVGPETGAIVGSAGVVGPVTEEAEEKRGPGLPEFLDGGRLDVVEERTKECKTRFMGEGCWYVPDVAVDLKWQGKGVGRLLLAAVTEVVDRTGQDVFLIATAMGQRLYRSVGFEEVGQVEMLGVVHSAMLRKARRRD